MKQCSTGDISNPLTPCRSGVLPVLGWFSFSPDRSQLESGGHQNIAVCRWVEDTNILLLLSLTGLLWNFTQ